MWVAEAAGPTTFSYSGPNQTGITYPDTTKGTIAYDATYNQPTAITDQRGITRRN
jgi:hypothetical protein